MVEGAALEMLYRGNSIVGSNPTLSAIFFKKLRPDERKEGEYLKEKAQWKYIVKKPAEKRKSRRESKPGRVARAGGSRAKAVPVWETTGWPQSGT